MKKIMLIWMASIFISVTVYSQEDVVLDGVKVYTQEGWKIKAKNFNNIYCIYSFSFVTEGTNKSGEVVYSKEETFGPATLTPYEERDLFTAPQDRNKEIIYTFKNIKLIKVKPVSKQEMIQNAKSGRR